MIRLLFVLPLLLASAGCTAESVRLALATQARADAVADALFQRQHASLRVLLFRDLQHRLTAAGAPVSPEITAALNNAWNERDLFEFWATQHERVRALRLVGVTTRLASAQATIDLLIKQLDLRLDRINDGLAAAAAQQLQPAPPEPAHDHH